MAITYSEIQTALADYLETDETRFTAQIPTFVKQAERRILNTVQLPNFRKNATSSLTSSDQYLAAPTDFLSPHSLAVDNSGYEYLLFKDVNFIREAFPSASTTGTPRFYGLFDDDTFIVGPTPDTGYTVELHYFYSPTSIVDDGTSWLGNNAEDALLWGTIVEAYVFQKGEPEILEMYKQRYEEAVTLLKSLGDGKNRQDNYRTEQSRVRVI